MTQRAKVDGQPAFVLHSYPYSETSLIIDLFSRDHGRVAALARGARRPRSLMRGLLQAFQPLEVGWTGRGEVHTLIRAEWQGGHAPLSGKALFCGYYLNELLISLLPRQDPHSRLFVLYGETLRRFSGGAQESDLRGFERALLQELGYGLSLTSDADGQPVDEHADYAYEIERGPVRLAAAGASPLSVSGRTLTDLARDDFSDPRSLAEAKQLMRAVISHYTGGKALASRRIFRELQELS
ncbi:MAG TPA: DNA repair protein RecO [Accumulibacter sp.]|nr:DNA repair protein RecO [Accumulibacter sp.]HMW17019.1 DNA repair protein RecO [Accumulibacter sp.]HNC17271.1 DNA repair protein RecO [Accumulibacter sp.]HND79835.1 DNA repair protein RecO [Accumulibacter sp.]HNE13990.1 DNA repair protein RecO [Accumulibacter sp.]